MASEYHRKAIEFFPESIQKMDPYCLKVLETAFGFVRSFAEWRRPDQTSDQVRGQRKAVLDRILWVIMLEPEAYEFLRRCVMLIAAEHVDTINFFSWGDQLMPSDTVYVGPTLSDMSIEDARALITGSK